MTLANRSTEFDGNYAEEQLRRSQHPLRRLIKSFYLRYLLPNCCLIYR